MNYYGDSKLLRHSIFSTAGSFGYRSPRIFYKLIPHTFFFCIFLNFTGIRCGTNFFCNSHALLGESRGYCTKTKQEWPDSGSTPENIFCNFYESNSSQGFFCIAKILVLMVNKMFTGLSRTVLAFSRDFLGFFFMCFPLFSSRKRKHINKLTPTHSRDNPEKLFLFIELFSPEKKALFVLSVRNSLNSPRLTSENQAIVKR